jgi:hypothetical protein
MEKVIHLFLMKQNSNSIIERTQSERRRVFRALIKIRIAMVKDVSEIFSGAVEVKRNSIRDRGIKRG